MKETIGRSGTSGLCIFGSRRREVSCLQRSEADHKVWVELHQIVSERVAVHSSIFTGLEQGHGLASGKSIDLTTTY